MKKIILAIFLLSCLVTVAQPPGHTPINNNYYWRSGAFQYMALPQDTFVVTASYQNFPWLAVKSDKVWRWSTAQLIWVEMSDKNVDWAVDIYPVLTDTLANYQHLLPVGSVTEYYRGDQTLSNFESDVITVTNPLYIQIGDTTSVQLPLVFHSPLFKTNNDVYVDPTVPVYYSSHFWDIPHDIGTPARNGMIWSYDSTNRRWVHALNTASGTFVAYSFQKSIQDASSVVTLVGDEESPGATKVYGTDSSGNKGWRDETAETDSIAQARIDSLITNWPEGNTFTNTDETDPVATAKTISLNAGPGVTITGSTTQALGGNPSWTVEAASENADLYADNLLVQPGYVTWSGTGLTFDVTAATYDIAHVRYTSAAGQITLDAADPTDPRIDVIAVDNTGSIVKITGTAEANPVQPQIDPSTQVLLTSILIPAGATTPYGVSDEVIYDENTEWTSAAGGLTANFDNATNNYNGSKSAAISGFSNGQYVQWTDAGLNAATNQVLSMQVRLSSNWNNSNNASIMLMRGAVPISQALLATNYGLVKTVTGGYQTVNIPITAFSPTDSFDRVRVTFIGNSGNTVNVDYVRLTNGVTTVVSSPSIFALHAYNGLTKVGKDSAKLGGTLTEMTLIDANDKPMVVYRKDDDNNTYVTTSLTDTGIDLLSKFNATRWAELAMQSTGSYSGTYAWLRAAYGSSEGAVQVTPGSIILNLMANGNIYTDSTGIVKFPQYGDGTYTGTPTKYAAFDADGNVIEVDAPSGGTGSPTWGSIGGLISDQTDLQSELDGKANTSHTHDASDITSGTLNTARIAGGTATATYVPISNGDGTATWGPQASGGTVTETKYWTIPAPTDTDNIGLFYFETAVTITALRDVVIGTSPSITYQIQFASTRNSGSPTNLFSSSRTTTSESGSSTTSFANASIPAGSYLWIKPSAVSGADQVELSISWQ